MLTGQTSTTCVLQVFEFSLLQKEYTPWSRALLKHGLHRLWLERDTPITHISFSRRNAAHLLLHDAFMLCVIDQTLPFPEPAAMLHNQLTLRSLPEAERSKFSHAFKICKTFQVWAAGRVRVYDATGAANSTRCVAPPPAAPPVGQPAGRPLPGGGGAPPAGHPVAAARACQTEEVCHIEDVCHSC